MNTITLEEPGRFSLSDTPEPPPPAEGEAQVRIHRVGICGTDIHAYGGTMPYFTYPVIPGHELGVEVVATGTGVSHVQAGDRCSVEPYLNCGHCHMCQAGRTNACPELKVLGIHTDGGMRELIIVPASKLHPSGELSYEHLALVETLGIGCHAVQRAGLSEGENVLVVGAGPIGLTVMAFARLAGAQVYAMDINAGRLGFCHREMQVKGTILAEEGEPAGELREMLGGSLPTVVFDATGYGPSMEASLHLVNPGGRLIYVGVWNGSVGVDDPEMHRKELTILASRNAPSGDFPFIIEKLESGELTVNSWITHRCREVELMEQFPVWLQPGSGLLKGVVSFAP